MQKRFESDPLFQATTLLLQERIPKAGGVPFAHRRTLRHACDCQRPGDAGARAQQPRHADTGGAVAVERQIPRDGHERGRRLQPLEGPRRHALARRHHLRQLGHVLLHPRRGERGVLVEHAISRRSSERKPTRRFSRRGGRNFAAATTISTRIPRSSFRRKTTSNCAGCASPTARGRAARSRSRATRKSFSRRLPRTRCIRRSAICSFRPRSSASGRRSSARAGRAPSTSRRRGCFT